MQETVTVSGASPVIDTSTTRVQQNFKMEQLQSIPNGRDMWALLAVTPSVQMGRIDVGGNRAGTQTGYTAYGMSGQVRVLIEGINTTEGTGGAGFYFDYASLEEAFLGTSGPVGGNAEPGRAVAVHRAQRHRTSSRASITSTGTTTRCRARTFPTSTSVPTAFNNSPIREHSNEIDRYYDHDINARRSDQEGQAVVRSAPIASSSTPWRSRTSSSTAPSTPSCGTRSAKVTYQMNQKNKLIGYYQWGQKEQPNRLPFATYTYASPEQTFKQDSGSWVYKGEWNGTISDKLYLEARYGDFGYYFPLITNSADNFFWHDTGRAISEGAHQIWQLDRDRKQYNLRGDLLPRHRQGQPHLQDGRRAAEGAVVGRLPAAARRQHRVTTTTTACRRP